MRQKLIYATLLIFLGVHGPTGKAQETDQNARPAQAEISEAIVSYVAAFNDRNLENLSRHWTADGVYSSSSTGERVNGREAIAEQFKAILAGETTSKLAVETESIELISPRVALERGRAIVTSGDTEVTTSDYTAVYVKEDGKWLIDRITEDTVEVEPNHYENLKALEWLIGEWVDDGEGFTIESTCDWTASQNYISRTYKVSNEQEGIESSGLQIIGWDAKEKIIRSWLFDSKGSFVSGTWTNRDDQWVVQSVATLADGSSGSSTSIFKPLDDGNYLWKRINRVVDGKLLPNINEITVRRK